MAICANCSHPYHWHPESGLTAPGPVCYGYGDVFIEQGPSGFNRTNWEPCDCRGFVALDSTALRTDQPTRLPLHLRTDR